MKTKIDLLKPHISNRELSYIEDAFADNWITTGGKNVDRFEKKIATFCEKKEVLCVNSGTSAIHLSLILLGVKKGDIVICQSFSFCASVNPVKYLGAIPVFVDSEEQTWNMNPYYLEKAIKECIDKKKKPKAIIVTDSYGMPAQWKELSSIAEKYDVPIIEDAAEALGSLYYGTNCGGFGDIAIYSFNGNKIVTTSAGGAMLLNSKKQKDEALHYATQAKESNEGYKHDMLGYNYRMSNVLAGVGIAQIEFLEERVKQKRQLNQFYFSLLKEATPFTLKQESQDVYSNYWLNCIRSNSISSLEKLKNEFKKERIEYRELWYPLHLQSIYKDCLFYGSGICNQIYKNGLALPSSTNLSENDKSRIAKTLNLFNAR